MQSLKTFLTQIFTWWSGQTLGTRFYTWRFGELVGEDEFGNKYYRARNTPLGERRWVIYNGVAEATAISSGWHGWMHHTTNIPPVDEEYRAAEWELPHRPNLTGSAGAYRPKGSALGRNRRTASTPGYKAWTPDS